VKHHLVVSLNGDAVPEARVPNFIREAFEENPDLDELNVRLSSGSWNVLRGDPRATIVQLGIDTSYFSQSMISKAEEISHDLEGDEQALDALGDLVVALIFEMHAYTAPGGSPLDVVEALRDQIEALVTTKQALEAPTQ
jgi:hypothetical protein